MSTTTNSRTRKTTAQIAAPIDLAESATPRTLDDLILDDHVLVDVWDDEEPCAIVLLGDEAAVVLRTTNLDDTLALVKARLRRGWGREGAVPSDIEVERYDGERPDFANRVAGVFAESRRVPFASWRLIEDTTGVSGE